MFFCKTPIELLNHSVTEYLKYFDRDDKAHKLRDDISRPVPSLQPKIKEVRIQRLATLHRLKKFLDDTVPWHEPKPSQDIMDRDKDIIVNDFRPYEGTPPWEMFLHACSSNATQS